MSKFGWDLPPGCTTADIERAFGDGDDTVCANCNEPLPETDAPEGWPFNGYCGPACAAELWLINPMFDDRRWGKSGQEEFIKAVRELIALAKQSTATESKRQKDFALQQFTGFGHASKGYDIEQLVGSMGLTADEWREIREDARMSLKERDITYIDEYFEKHGGE